MQRRVHWAYCAAIMRVSSGKPRSMPKIVVTDRDGQQHEVEGRVGLKVMETLRELDYGVLAICGGLCSCATCHVHVASDWADKLPTQEGDEKELLMELSHYDPA